MRTTTATGLSVEETVAIRVAGELDLSTADALRRLVEGALRSGRPVLIDLSDVTFIDVSGLHAVLDPAANSRDTSGCVMTALASPAVLRLLRLLQIDISRSIRVVAEPDHDGGG